MYKMEILQTFFFVKYGYLCTHNVQNERSAESLLNFVKYGGLGTHNVIKDCDFLDDVQ